MNPSEDHNFKLLDQTFPNIASQLRIRWGTAQFRSYMQGLQQDNGIEHRAGFPGDVMLALMAVGDEHDRKFPQFVPQKKWLS
ncbi:MAG: hypothetical protein KA254_06490 [Rhodoferax sp.]|nr:hypothetical protein [Rhodoferax sp.]